MPHWRHMPVYRFPGLAFLNFSDILNPMYGRTRMPHHLGKHVDMMCTSKGIPIANEFMFSGPYMSPLRQLPQRLGVPVFVCLGNQDFKCCHFRHGSNCINGAPYA